VTEQGEPDGKAQGGGELIEKLRVEGIEHLEPFSTLGDQTILFRPSPVGGWPHGTELSQVILAGNLARIEVADLVNFLTMSRLTGILLLIDVDYEKTLHFNRGELVFASSSNTNERIGEVLVRLGKINQRQLEAVSLKFPGNMQIGRFMVQQELISPQVLWEGIREQVREIFFGFLESNRGEFFFLEAKPSAGAELNLSLTTRNLLLEGVQRKDELAHYRTKIPNDEVVFTRRHPLPTKELTPNERKILRLVDGKSSIIQLAMLSQLDRFVTLKTLFHLSQAGFVEIRDQARGGTEGVRQPAKGATDTPVDEARLREVAEVFNEIYAEIFQALRNRMPAAGALKTMNAFFQNLEPRLALLFRGLRLREDGRLDVETLLANLDQAADADPDPFLTAALKELFFFCVFEATSRLEPAEEEALMERVQKLQNNLRA
jgi:hypothetical protein